MAAKSSRRNKASTVRAHPGLPGPKTLGLVDLFMFLLDSRIPKTSLDISEPYLARKKRVYVMTKPDLADPLVTQKWVDWFRDRDIPCFAVQTNSGRGMSGLADFLKQRQVQMERKAGVKVLVRPLRLMLFGPPNVGKSSLANRLLRSSKAPFGSRPGLTRGSHWLRGRGSFEILDTPGVIDTSKVTGEILHKLAVTWAVRENQYDQEEAALWLAGEVLQSEAPAALIAEFGRSRGLIGSGGKVDLERTFMAFIKAFRQGEFGGISIETPDDILD